MPATSLSAVFPCTEAGILSAVAAGGGPHTFSCVGPATTVSTTAEIAIANAVILDGEEKLTVESLDGTHRLFSVGPGATVELRGMTIAGGTGLGEGGGILNQGILTISGCTVRNNIVSSGGGSALGGGISNLGDLTVIESTVRDNLLNASLAAGGGINNGVGATATIERSTISGNEATGSTSIAGGIGNDRGTLHIVNSTVSGNQVTGTLSADGAGVLSFMGTLTLTHVTIANNTSSPSGSSLASDIFPTINNSLIEGTCNLVASVSNGGNLESPGSSCGFLADGDQVNVTPGQLALGPLQDNGGPTFTHALPEGSAAADAALLADCEAEDQRGVARPAFAGCDVGAFERESTAAITAVGVPGLAALAGLLLGASWLAIRRSA